MPDNKNGNKYTFDSFAVTDANRTAFEKAKQFAENADSKPLAIFGGTATGKTHLLYAAKNAIEQNSPELHVIFTTTADMVSTLTSIISNGGTSEQFREKYMQADVLLVDDIQFIAGKESTQEEFFNTYSNLMTYGKQVVMTCDVPPKHLSGLEERLITRFQQGIVIEIESPSYETRLAILKSKAKNCRHKIPEEIFNYISENIKSSVRAMEGALNLIIRYIDANPGIEINKQITHGLLKELTEDEVTIRRLSIGEIVKAVCTTYDVTHDDLLSNNRTQPLATARQVAMFLARKLTGNSTPTIADESKRNHTTVLHGTQTIQKRIDVEPELKKKRSDAVIWRNREVEMLLDIVKTDYPSAFFALTETSFYYAVGNVSYLVFKLCFGARIICRISCVSVSRAANENTAVLFLIKNKQTAATSEFVCSELACHVGNKVVVLKQIF